MGPRTGRPLYEVEIEGEGVAWRGVLEIDCCSGRERTVTIFSPEGEEDRVLRETLYGGVDAAAFNSDGRHVVTAARLWESLWLAHVTLSGMRTEEGSCGATTSQE